MNLNGDAGMNGKNVFDSTVIIKFLDKEPDFIDLSPMLENDDCFVSIITKMEILGWPEITAEDEARINHFLSKVIMLPITDHIEEATISIRRKTKLKLPDAIIAATAIVIGAQVVTTDPHFFKCTYPELRIWKTL
jgi:predicted nucleic acid-binding protein